MLEKKQKQNANERKEEEAREKKRKWENLPLKMIRRVEPNVLLGKFFG